MEDKSQDISWDMDSDSNGPSKSDTDPCGRMPMGVRDSLTIHQTIKRVGAQVKETYRRAFLDLLKERTASNPPDCEWLTRLYGEIRTKLTKLLKPESQLRKEIESSMDCELFHQMISNNAFNPEDFYKLIRYVFEKCKQLGSPARDSATDAKLQEIVDFVDSGKATFSTLVPLFIKNANECLDAIYEDVRNFAQFIRDNSTAPK